MNLNLNPWGQQLQMGAVYTWLNVPLFSQALNRVSNCSGGNVNNLQKSGFNFERTVPHSLRQIVHEGIEEFCGPPQKPVPPHPCE